MLSIIFQIKSHQPIEEVSHFSDILTLEAKVQITEGYMYITEKHFVIRLNLKGGQKIQVGLIPR